VKGDGVWLLVNAYSPYHH